MANLVLAVIAFGALIFVHELGHFLIAKRVGVTVYAFALGFGPRLIGFTRGETRYAINAFPLGGYVRLAGEDLDASTDPGSFRSKTVWQRIAVVAAGPLMNILLAIVLTTSTALIWGIPVGTSNHIARLVTSGGGMLGWVTGRSAPQTPAQTAGLRAGDAIVAIDGVRMDNGDSVVEAIHSTPYSPVPPSIERGLPPDDLTAIRQRVLTIEREGKRFEVTVTPRLDPRLRIGLIGFAVETLHERVGPVQAVVYGFVVTWRYVDGILSTVSGLAGNPRELFNQLAGPVGAGKILGDAAQVGIWSYIDTAAVLSVTIGIFNLLPVPALDGGRLLFLAVEAVRRRPMNPRLEAYVHVAGFALLLLLLVTLTWRDIVRQLTGGM